MGTRDNFLPEFRDIFFADGDGEEATLLEEENGDALQAFFEQDALQTSGVNVARLREETADIDARFGKRFAVAPEEIAPARQVARVETDGHVRKEFDAAGRLVRQIEFSLFDLCGVAAEFDATGACVKTYRVEQTPSGEVKAVA
jgi:hypothetical protein